MSIASLARTYSGTNVTIDQAGVGMHLTDSFVTMAYAMLVGIGLVYLLMLMVPMQDVVNEAAIERAIDAMNPVDPHDRQRHGGGRPGLPRGWHGCLYPQADHPPAPRCGAGAVAEGCHTRGVGRRPSGCVRASRGVITCYKGAAR
jgi:hypothetical protein